MTADFTDKRRCVIWPVSGDEVSDRSRSIQALSVQTTFLATSASGPRYPLTDGSSAFEIGQPALHFFTYVEMILDIFECGVIGKILN